MDGTQKHMCALFATQDAVFTDGKQGIRSERTACTARLIIAECGLRGSHVIVNITSSRRVDGVLNQHCQATAIAFHVEKDRTSRIRRCTRGDPVVGFSYLPGSVPVNIVEL